MARTADTPTIERAAAAREQIVRLLSEAHATELALVQTLQAHISITPSGSYRRGLERHLGETREHAGRIERRLGDLGVSRNPLEAGAELVQALVGQALAMGKLPIDLLRGSGGEERLLKNAKDEVAGEALEIATYDALERFAHRVGDDETATLAADIRADEERMLARLRKEIVALADGVADAKVDGEPVYDVRETGAADTLRAGARRARGRARSTARQARRVPGVARVEGEVRGVVASESDLAIPGYDGLTVDEITARLPELAQVELGKVAGYERSHRTRTTILDRVQALRASEPWPGFDELGVEDVRAALAGADEERIAAVRDYERRHKNRAGVMQAVERRLAVVAS